MANTIGILLFDGVEEMDFAGPWEVFTAAAEGLAGERVLTIAERKEAVRCAKGLRVIPDVTYADAPALDLLLIPGGRGTRREAENPKTLEWLKATSRNCTWVTSVCTGSYLLVATGLANGKRITTHHENIEDLRHRPAAGQNTVEVVKGVRFLRDGNVVSAAGVMSGIEMSLWLTRQLYGPEVEAQTRSYIAYDFPPRTSAQGA